MTDNCRKYTQNHYTQAYNSDGSRRTMLTVGLEESGKRKKISAENENNFQAVQKEKRKERNLTRTLDSSKSEIHVNYCYLLSRFAHRNFLTH